MSWVNLLFFLGGACLGGAWVLWGAGRHIERIKDKVSYSVILAFALTADLTYGKEFRDSFLDEVRKVVISEGDTLAEMLNKAYPEDKFEMVDIPVPSST